MPYPQSYRQGNGGEGNPPPPPQHAPIVPSTGELRALGCDGSGTIAQIGFEQHNHGVGPTGSGGGHSAP